MTNKTTPDNSGYARAATLGFVAGLRSMTPFALLSAASQRQGSPAGFAAMQPAPLGLLRSRGTLVVTGLAVIGELVGDKLPMVPNRTQPGPLGARLVVGGLAGAAVGADARLNPIVCGVLGAAAAAASSYAGASYRKAADATGVPDVVWALLEDATAIGLGYAALKQYFS